MLLITLIFKEEIDIICRENTMEKTHLRILAPFCCCCSVETTREHL